MWSSVSSHVYTNGLVNLPIFALRNPTKATAAHLLTSVKQGTCQSHFTNTNTSLSISANFFKFGSKEKVCMVQDTFHSEIVGGIVKLVNAVF